MNFLKDAQSIENLYIEVPKQPLLTLPTQSFLSFGSCFAQNLQKHIAGFGIRITYLRDICGHYSTGSIANMIDRLVHPRELSEEDLFRFPDSDSVGAYEYMLKRHYHGPKAVERLKSEIAVSEELIRQELLHCDFLTITLGSCRVIRMKRNDRIINAAAGIGSEHWYTEMLSVQQNLEYLERILKLVNQLDRPKPPKIIITISPQRYLFSQGLEDLKDTSPFLDNSLAKSILRVAVDEFTRRHSAAGVAYFPSYEIVMDELRLHESISNYDYCHIEQYHTPKYVVKRFLETYCSDDTLAFLENFEAASGTYAAMCGLLDQGMSPEARQYQQLVDNLESIRARTAPAFQPAIFGRIEMDRMQKKGAHQEVIDYYESIKELLPDPRSHWKAAESYREIGDNAGAKSILESLELNTRCLADIYPNVRRDIQNSLDLLTSTAK